jgi:SAM-dependent methyltransferase
LDAYYAERSKYTYAHADGAESPFDFKRFEAIADQLEPHLPSKEARILDIGCATGGLLAVLKGRGYTHVVGSDPSPACADAARRLHGIEVRTATLAEHAAWTERFDAVLLVGVLEHVREVRAAVGIAAGLLRSGGVLYGAQPDVEGFAACVNAPYQQFSTEHVNFFSTASLNRLLATAELAPVATWRWLVEWREGVTDSVVSGVFARSAQGESGRLEASAASAGLRDVVSRGALLDYVAQSAAGEAATRQLIEELVRTQEPLLVWGAGTLTRHLLATTPDPSSAPPPPTTPSPAHPHPTLFPCPPTTASLPPTTSPSSCERTPTFEPHPCRPSTLPAPTYWPPLYSTPSPSWTPPFPTSPPTLKAAFGTSPRLPSQRG